MAHRITLHYITLHYATHTLFSQFKSSSCRYCISLLSLLGILLVRCIDACVRTICKWNYASPTSALGRMDVVITSGNGMEMVETDIDICLDDQQHP